MAAWQQISVLYVNRDPSWMMKLPLAAITVLVVLLGIWSQPIVTFLRQIASGVIF